MLRGAIVPVIALLLLPLGSAEWRGAGGLEPDTAYDRAGGMMFLEGDSGTDPALQQVHFQAFVAAPETSFNPNLALVGSSILPAPALHHRALLGVWKDCNGDGYIGNAESALMDYPAAILVSETTCPSIEGATFPVHNDGAFVSELLSIGMVDPCEHEQEIALREACGVDAYAPNERVHYANGTFVWGDLGAPGSIPETECILAPLPSGTTSGTGAMLAWSDCQSRRGIAQSVNEVDRDGSLGLRFEDTARPEDSSSTLNQPFPATPFGHAGEPGLLQDDTSESSARVWDCDGGTIADVRDPEGYRELALADPTGQLHAERFPLVVVYTLTGVGFEDEDNNDETPGVFRRALTDEEGTYARIPSLGPNADRPTASWWVALEALVDGPAGDCDPATDSAIAPAYLGAAIESDATPILEARKDRTSLTFTFFDGHRGLHPNLDPYTGATTPSDGGTFWLDHGGTARGGDGPLWSALSQSEQDPQLVDREDLEYSGPVYYTYYAHLGQAARIFTLPTYEPRTYGVDNCADHDTGVHLGWVCDTSLWWRDADGNPNVPTYAQGLRIGRVPGDLYHMRDVDCYDGEIADGTSVFASLVYFTSEGGCL